jgi:hypothetical protein
VKVRYIGPHEGVDVVMPDGRTDAVVGQGGILDTTAEHAAALLEQPANWEPVKGSAKKGGDQ